MKQRLLKKLNKKYTNELLDGQLSKYGQHFLSKQLGTDFQIALHKENKNNKRLNYLSNRYVAYLRIDSMCILLPYMYVNKYSNEFDKLVILEKADLDIVQFEDILSNFGDSVDNLIGTKYEEKIVGFSGRKNTEQMFINIYNSYNKYYTNLHENPKSDKHKNTLTQHYIDKIHK